MTASVHSNLIRPEVKEEERKDPVAFLPLSSCFMINDCSGRLTLTDNFVNRQEENKMLEVLLLDTALDLPSNVDNGRPV